MRKSTNKLTEQQVRIIENMETEDQSIIKVSDKMCIARSTLNYHLDCIRKKTGYDARKFNGLNRLLRLLQEEYYEPDEETLEAVQV